MLGRFALCERFESRSRLALRLNSLNILAGIRNQESGIRNQESGIPKPEAGSRKQDAPAADQIRGRQRGAQSTEPRHRRNAFRACSPSGTAESRSSR
jgi:hypothetical protein